MAPTDEAVMHRRQDLPSPARFPAEQQRSGGVRLTGLPAALGTRLRCGRTGSPGMLLRKVLQIRPLGKLELRSQQEGWVGVRVRCRLQRIFSLRSLPAWLVLSRSVGATVLLCENRDKAASWCWHFRQIFFCSPESSLRFHLNPQKTASH